MDVILQAEWSKPVLIGHLSRFGTRSTRSQELSSKGKVVLQTLSLQVPMCVMSHSYTLPGDIDITRRKKAWEAWDAAVRLCPILRTRIVYNESRGSLQVVMKEEMFWRTVTSLEAAGIRKDVL